MNRTFTVCFIFVSILQMKLRGEDSNWFDKWDTSGRDWTEKWTNTMNSIDTFSPEDRIIVLSSALGVGESGNLGEHQKPIYYRAQSMLLSMRRGQSQITDIDGIFCATGSVPNNRH